MKALSKKLSKARDDYIRCIRPAIRREANAFRSYSFVNCVRLAALARTADGGIHKHQRRIRSGRLAILASRLSRRLPGIARAKTFEELIGVVDSARPKGVGELTVYDNLLKSKFGSGFDFVRFRGP